MKDSIKEIINSYNPDAPLAEASTIPAAWYTDGRVFELEKQMVFSRSWQFAARIDQLREAGDYVTTEIAGEPIVIVRGSDGELRGFFNVCRHHAAAVMTEPAGRANQMRCPYHGWTYSLEGELKGTPDFDGVCNFDREANGLVRIAIATREQWVFVRLDGGHNPPLNNAQSDFDNSLGTDLIKQFQSLNLNWLERRRYTLNCNWKVFVDNYLDGGYHVPHLHKGLDSVLDYSNYTIENGERFCLQSSPMVNRIGDDVVSAVRTGQRARYYWLYPNFMVNCYEGVMDTNLVRPLAVDRTEVIFDFYFADISEQARERNLASIDVGERIQQEDLDICESVQRGLQSRAYDAGRLSVRREAGEHLFHRLLHADLKDG
ncbi:MAG TPA: aromatic ring-hydroxylating dioxygenase subunit alpha [Pyrinomonadaceae bacterium]|nr:aromatic ring-hydroxylating dioxygenase subunit alpha [Pyrinomonadaceae bacterium]